MKPYLVINVVDGEIGIIKERPTWESALDIAVYIASEQCDTSEESIRLELERDTSFITADGSIVVQIAQADED